MVTTATIIAIIAIIIIIGGIIPSNNAFWRSVIKVG